MTKLNEAVSNRQLVDTALQRLGTPLSVRETKPINRTTQKCSCGMGGWHKISCHLNHAFNRG